MSTGKFITFEGGDGCGKSTHIGLVADALSEKGFEVVRVREPGGTAISEKLREMVLDPANSEMADACELFIYEAARAQLVAEVIKPALERGAIVLCDRFYDSTTAYQAYGRGLDRSFVNAANMFACQGAVPDRTIVLWREEGAAEGIEMATMLNGPDRLESAGLDFQTDVVAAFMDMAASEPKRFRPVKVGKTIEETSAAVFAALSDVIEGFA